FG
ncbi:hypothetical protein D021_0813B, partial [Vibrio parahaemolyticus 10296]